MPVNFQIPGSAQYMPRTSQQPMGDPALSDEPLNPGAPGGFGPIEQQILQHVLATLNEQPPVAPPEKKHSRFVQGMINADPYFSAVRQQNYQGTPEYKQYSAKLMGYQERQKQLAPAAAMIGGMNREQRLANVPYTLKYTDPTGGVKTLPLMLNKQTGQFMDTNGLPVSIPPGGVLSPIGETPYETAGGGTGFAPNTYMPGMGMAQPQGRTPLTGWSPEGGGPTTAPQTIPGLGPPAPGTGSAPAAAPPVTQGGSRGPMPANVGGPTVRPQGNQLGLRPAPPMMQEQALRASKLVSGMHDILSTWDTASSAQQQRFGESPLGVAGQQAQDLMSQGRYTRGFIDRFGDPQVADYYTKIRQTTYDYVKQQTGAQFSITEMDRYLALFPTTADTPQRAHALIQEVVDRAVREINTIKFNWPSIQVGNEQVYVSPQYLQEFLGGGGGQPEQTQPTGGSPFFQQWMQRRGHRVVSGRP